MKLIRFAKSQGIKVTAEACPHHFALTDEACSNFDTSTKVNPPLRSKEDVQAIKEAIADGTIDCIVTDHAPHTKEDKEVPISLEDHEHMSMNFWMGVVGLDMQEE